MHARFRHSVVAFSASDRESMLYQRSIKQRTIIFGRQHPPSEQVSCCSFSARAL
jgi:hypothetical protein